jgi:hypothetical protein
MAIVYFVDGRGGPFFDYVVANRLFHIRLNVKPLKKYKIKIINMPSIKYFLY